MRKISPVEDARVLMTAAKDWPVWRWLMEKKRVRAAADRANEALAQEEERVKAGWSDDLRNAYRELELLASLNGDAKARREYEKLREEARNIPPEIKQAVKNVRNADVDAYNMHLDAEDTFEEAGRTLSTSLAREGARQAIESWDLHEKAIRKAEAVVRRK